MDDCVVSYSTAIGQRYTNRAVYINMNLIKRWAVYDDLATIIVCFGQTSPSPKRGDDFDD